MTTVFDSSRFVHLSKGPLAGEVFRNKTSLYDLEVCVFGLQGQGAFSSRFSKSVTHYVFNHQGSCEITLSSSKRTFSLAKNMFARLSEDFSLLGGAGVVISQFGFDCLFQLGGPIADAGRLRYINGATDTVLVQPELFGEPCLNHMHFPKDVKQTLHTHPSLRVNVCAKGEGICELGMKDQPPITIPIKEGDVFVMPAESEHAFMTTDSTLDVITYHPETEFGPKHDDHPMLNRTYVRGLTAQQIAEIRTV